MVVRLNESASEYSLDDALSVCEQLKKDIDKIKYLVNKYPDNYDPDKLVHELVDIETALYEIWR